MAVILSELIKAESGIRSAFYPRIALEMTLIRLSMLSHLKSVNEALRIVSSQQSVANSQESKVQKIENKVKKIEDIWNVVLEKINETNHPLYCKLNEGSASFGNGEIKIAFNGGLSVHAESVKENIPFIKRVIQDISGRDISINVETVEVKSVSKKDLKEDALNNPIIKEAIELFEGRIVDVIPNSKGQPFETPEDRFFK
jgi:DNA polymerase-3 subunit gamma/tau